MLFLLMVLLAFIPGYAKQGEVRPPKVSSTEMQKNQKQQSGDQPAAKQNVIPDKLPDYRVTPDKTRQSCITTDEHYCYFVDADDVFSEDRWFARQPLANLKVKPYRFEHIDCSKSVIEKYSNGIGTVVVREYYSTSVKGLMAQCQLD